MLFSMSVLGELRQNYMRAIFAFFIEVGPFADLEGFNDGNTNPSTRFVSSMVPPSFFTTFMSLKSTFVAVLGSMT